MKVRGTLYRIVMKLAHRFNWHFAPPIYPDGDTQLWCKWCGFRQTIIKREVRSELSGSQKDNGASIQ